MIKKHFREEEMNQVQPLQADPQQLGELMDAEALDQDSDDEHY